MAAHPKDQKEMHRGAACLGSMVADGLLDPDEAKCAIRDAVACVAGVDHRSGLQTKLMWRMSDARATRLLAKSVDERRVRATVRVCLAQGAPTAVILRAAENTAGVLTARESREVAGEEAARWMIEHG